MYLLGCFGAPLHPLKHPLSGEGLGGVKRGRTEVPRARSGAVGSYLSLPLFSPSVDRWSVLQSPGRSCGRSVGWSIGRSLRLIGRCLGRSVGLGRSVDLGCSVGLSHGWSWGRSVGLSDASFFGLLAATRRLSGLLVDRYRMTVGRSVSPTIGRRPPSLRKPLESAVDRSPGRFSKGYSYVKTVVWSVGRFFLFCRVYRSVGR